MKAGDHLFLVDGSAYIFRAYHALPPLTRKSDGLPVGAVAGFCNMLWKLVCDARDTSVGVVPTHFAVIFDYSSKTFRNELYPAYKANRVEPPEDLRPQFALIRQATKAFNLPCIEMEGFEADDIIATYARQAREAGGDVTIISSDKDLMQLVGPKVILYDQMKDKRLGIAEVIEKWGVPPEKMADLQALTGDSTDNVPGVPGIGPKTAAQLLAEYGDLETLLARAGEIRQEKRREGIIANTELVRLSRQLVMLKDDVPLEIPLDDLFLDKTDGPQVVAFLKAMEFNTLTRRVAEVTGTDASQIEPAEIKVNGYEAMRGPDLDPQTPQAASVHAAGSPAAFADARIASAPSLPFVFEDYECIRDEAGLARWVGMIRAAGIVAIDTETTSLDPMQAVLCGISLSTRPGNGCYIPLGHRDGAADDLLGGGHLPDQIPEPVALDMLAGVLTDPSILKIGQNMKYDWLIFSEHGIDLRPVDDTMLLSYVLDAGQGNHGMDELSMRWLGHECISYKSLTGSGQGKITFDQVEVEKAALCGGRCRCDAAPVAGAEASPWSPKE